MEFKIFPEKAVIVTDTMILHITIHPYKDRDTGIVESYSVNIGSKDKKCIHLTVPV